MEIQMYWCFRSFGLRPQDDKRSPQDDKRSPQDDKRSPQDDKRSPQDNKRSPQDNKGYVILSKAKNLIVGLSF